MNPAVTARRGEGWGPARELGWCLAAVAGGLLLAGATLAALGVDPMAAYAAILDASLGSVGGLGQTLSKASPLLLGALAVTFAMRGGYLNIGVDGQLSLGAVLAVGLAFWLPSWPAPLLLPLALVAGVVGGLLAVLPAALLRARWGVSEIFVTVMLNFVIAQLVDYLATGPWNDPTAGEAISRPIAQAAFLPDVLPGGGSPGVLVGLGVAAALAWLLRGTVLGYELRAAGASAAAARVGGVSLVRAGLVALGTSGAVAGLAGAIEVTGYHHRLLNGISPNYGLMAILIAFLGRRTVSGTVAAALGFAILLVGADSLQRSVDLPASAALLFQAAILLCLLAVEALRGRLPSPRRGLAGLARSGSEEAPS
jgi:ABC-type uncharacterized transport system permease subunit